MSVSVWTRSAGWDVDFASSSPSDLGGLSAPQDLRFSGGSSGLTISHVSSRWNGRSCTFVTGTNETVVTGSLATPVQDFKITLVPLGGGKHKLEGDVEAGQDEIFLPPAGGTWTALEGS